MSNKRKRRVRSRRRFFTNHGTDSRTPAEKAARTFALLPDTADLLHAAHVITGSTYRRLARRFKQHPQAFAEFHAAHMLGADVAAMKDILTQLLRKTHA